MGQMVMSFNYGQMTDNKQSLYLNNNDGSGKKLQTFEILLPYPVTAQAAAQDIFKKGSHSSYLTVNFLKSHFCLGHKVILEVTTDDEKYFCRTIAPSEERPEVSWVKEALSQKHLEDVISIVYHSFHAALQQKNRCGLNDDDSRVEKCGSTK